MKWGTENDAKPARDAMDSQSAIDLAREAILFTMLVSAPMLAAGLIVGLVIGLLQAVTQVHEQTVAFVPKILAMLAALLASLPWLVSRMVEYSEHLIRNIPNTL